MLNVELTQRWVGELRSGDYIQEQAYLHTQFGHCCLGVAEEMVRGKDCWKPIDGNCFVLAGTNNKSWLSPETATALGLPAWNECARFSREFSAFAPLRDVFNRDNAPVSNAPCYYTVAGLGDMNDKGRSFKAISEALELALKFEADTGKPAFDQ